ncbi:MAG: hypothetical protein K6A38_09320 [Lachnospiraceae bacterium]|nr:hypothetical protein [Lachnospiraceae bacterium]
MTKRLTAVLLTISLAFSSTACSAEEVKGKADSAKNSIEKAADEAADTIGKTASDVSEVVSSKAAEAVGYASEWYSNIDTAKFKQGWNYSVEFLGEKYSEAVDSEYIRSVAENMAKIRSNMESASSALIDSAIDKEQLAMKWATETYSDVKDASLEMIEENSYLKYFSSADKEASKEAMNLLVSYYDYARQMSSPVELKDYIDDFCAKESADLNALYKSVLNDQELIIPDEQMPGTIAYITGISDKMPGETQSKFLSKDSLYERTVKSLKKRYEDNSLSESKAPTAAEIIALAQLAEEGTLQPSDFNVSVSTLLCPKYVLKQACYSVSGMSDFDDVVNIGSSVYSILKEAASDGHIDTDALKKGDMKTVLASSDGFVEGSVSQFVISGCREGNWGEYIKDDPSLCAVISVLVIDGAVIGYDLCRGDITLDEYGNMMADMLFTSLLSLPTNAVVIALLPSLYMTALAGSMAGVTMVALGYEDSEAAKSAMLDVVNGGGFEAFVPAGTTEAISVAKSKIESLSMKNKISSFKDTMISTTKEGYINIETIPD